jgi:F-type H+-transporting ATPase subunit b
VKAALLGLLMVLVPASILAPATLYAQAKAPTKVDPNDDAPAAAHAHDEHDHDHDHDHGEHAHLGHEGASTKPDEVKGDLAIFTAIVFLLLVVILRKFAWGPITAGLEKREGHIAHEIAAAEKANADAKLLLADYQKKLDAAQAEVRALLEEARRDAEHTKQEIVTQARAEAAVEADRAKREIDTAKDQAMKELAVAATDQALLLAGKLLQQKLQAADHARLVEDALAKFPKTKAGLN